jgi:hypothetical protein
MVIFLNRAFASGRELRSADMACEMSREKRYFCGFPAPINHATGCLPEGRA